jgi:hypothetical protein
MRGETLLREVLSAAESAEYARLVAWFQAAPAPAAPYWLDQATFVADPVRSHREHLRQIQAGQDRGQMRRAMLARLRKLAALFGGPA